MLITTPQLSITNTSIAARAVARRVDVPSALTIASLAALIVEAQVALSLQTTNVYMINALILMSIDIIVALETF